MNDRGPRDTPDDARPGLLLAVIFFYGLMALGAWGLARVCDLDFGRVVLGASDASSPEAGGPSAAVDGASRDVPLPLPLSVTAGAATGLAFVLLSRPFLGARAMAAFRSEVRAAIGRPGPGAILVLAASSAVGEELLFRGALQALLGFWPTALIFALLHGGGVRRLLGWTVFAGLAGLALGQLAAWTGSLLAPIIAHATVNQLNLEALSRLPEEDTA